jgi:hypothetical protein
MQRGERGMQARKVWGLMGGCQVRLEAPGQPIARPVKCGGWRRAPQQTGDSFQHRPPKDQKPKTMCGWQRCKLAGALHAHMAADAAALPQRAAAIAAAGSAAGEAPVLWCSLC